MRAQLFAALAMAAMLAAGCRAQQPENRDGPRAPITGISLSGDQSEDEQMIRRLEEEARQLARAGGCERDEQCAAAPAGAKACGGPRYFIPYCRLTTDTAALFTKLDQLHRTEDEYNRHYGIISDCMLVTEPPVSLVGGACELGVRSSSSGFGKTTP